MVKQLVQGGLRRLMIFHFNVQHLLIQINSLIAPFLKNIISIQAFFWMTTSFFFKTDFGNVAD